MCAIYSQTATEPIQHAPCCLAIISFLLILSGDVSAHRARQCYPVLSRCADSPGKQLRGLAKARWSPSTRGKAERGVLSLPFPTTTNVLSILRTKHTTMQRAGLLLSRACQPRLRLVTTTIVSRVILFCKPGVQTASMRVGLLHDPMLQI